MLMIFLIKKMINFDLLIFLAYEDNFMYIFEPSGARL